MKNRKKFIVAIDQGTTSSRAILFNSQGKSLFKSQLEFKQYFPKNGWVEHNPEEIWNKTKKVLMDTINKSKRFKGDILTIGYKDSDITINLNPSFKKIDLKSKVKIEWGFGKFEASTVKT